MSDQILDFLLKMAGGRNIEIAAVALGLANVALIIRRNIWNYPFGIAMVILYAQIFYEYRLYSDSALQIFYLGIQVYGWWYWWHGRGADGRVIVERASTRTLAILALGALTGTAVLGTAMARLTDAAAPFLDGAITLLSVVAQFLMSRRRLESWVVWIIVDLLAIGLFWAKDLQPTAMLYGVFLVLAGIGFLAWLQAWREGGAAT